MQIRQNESVLKAFQEKEEFLMHDNDKINLRSEMLQEQLNTHKQQISEAEEKWLDVLNQKDLTIQSLNDQIRLFNF